LGSIEFRPNADALLLYDGGLDSHYGIGIDVGPDGKFSRRPFVAGG